MKREVFKLPQPKEKPEAELAEVEKFFWSWGIDLKSEYERQVSNLNQFGILELHPRREGLVYEDVDDNIVSLPGYKVFAKQMHEKLLAKKVKQSHALQAAIIKSVPRWFEEIRISSDIYSQMVQFAYHETDIAVRAHDVEDKDTALKQLLKQIPPAYHGKIALRLWGDSRYRNLLAQNIESFGKLAVRIADNLTQRGKYQLVVDNLPKFEGLSFFLGLLLADAGYADQVKENIQSFAIESRLDLIERLESQAV